MVESVLRKYSAGTVQISKYQIARPVFWELTDVYPIGWNNDEIQSIL